MDRSSLQGHLVNKHGTVENAFTCQYCERKFGYKYQLNAHISTKHLSCDNE